MIGSNSKHGRTLHRIYSNCPALQVQVELGGVIHPEQCCFVAGSAEVDPDYPTSRTCGSMIALCHCTASHPSCSCQPQKFHYKSQWGYVSQDDTCEAFAFKYEGIPYLDSTVCKTVATRKHVTTPHLHFTKSSHIVHGVAQHWLQQTCCVTILEPSPNQRMIHSMATHFKDSRVPDKDRRPSSRAKMVLG